MTARTTATLEAVEIVRPALEAYYNSLSDEQKERFNRIGPRTNITSAEPGAALPADAAKTCKEAKPALTALPIEQIEQEANPTGAQLDDLDRLHQAIGQAAEILQAACPVDTPLTPPGRLEAVQTRLKAMIDAANTVKPALDRFYSSLSNEQKTRFNQLGHKLACAK